MPLASRSDLCLDDPEAVRADGSGMSPKNYLNASLSILLLAVLCGCLPTYIVSNELSDRYIESGDFFDPQFTALRQNDVLFYIWTGYYNKDERKLIVFLRFDVNGAEGVLLKAAVLQSKGETIARSVVTDSSQGREKKVAALSLFNGGARLAFDIDDVAGILDDASSLQVDFRHKGLDGTIRMDLQIELKLVWPT